MLLEQKSIMHVLTGLCQREYVQSKLAQEYRLSIFFLDIFVHRVF